jgi:hypothetical protein
LEHGSLAQEPVEHGNVTQEPIEQGHSPRDPVDQAMGTASEQRASAPAWLSGPTRTVVIGLGVVALVGVVALLVGLGSGPKEADSQAATSMATAPSPPTTPTGTAGQLGNAAAAPAADAHAKAGQLRREATKLCKDAQWDKCIANFDEAARLDPVGDSVVPIQRWRAAAAATAAKK